MNKTEIEGLIKQVEAVGGSERDRARRLIGLAEVIAGKGFKIEAYHLCQKVLASAAGDSEIFIRLRRVLARLIPSYHISMMNDARRNGAWERALTRAISPGIRALEVGTGAGVLALMAARAGARVYTCEDDPVIAAIARQMMAINGLSDRVTVIEKRSQDLDPSVDLGGPADLIFCDIFTDSLLGFDPLTTLADARRRLVKPEGASLPRAGSIWVALANWQEYTRLCHIERGMGFDMTPMAAFVPDAFRLPIDDPGLSLFSGGREAFRFDFTALDQPAAGEVIVPLGAERDGVVNGIVQWIHLDLDDETMLEARPHDGSLSFSSPLFYPLLNEVSMQRNDVVSVRVNHDGRRLNVWV